MAQKKKNKKEKEEKVDKCIIASKKVKKTCSLNICLILAFLASIFVAVRLYGIYKELIDVPDMPDLDLNTWWGPEEKKHNQDTLVRKFRIFFSEAMQDEFYKRSELYRRRKSPKSFNETAWTYGINSESVDEVFESWQFHYNFKQRENYLNQYNHFKTNIQGLDIHFIHAKPKEIHENTEVLPLLLLHGWPGSVREFYDALPLLTTKRPGYDFVFEVIAPSLPGFGYSDASKKPGMNPTQISIIMRNLMHRLGFERFYIQGGDFGHAVGSNLATIFPDEVLGFHTNMIFNPTKSGVLLSLLSSLWPSYIGGEHSDQIMSLKDQLQYYLEEFGYMHLQATKPDTIGISLQDSPMGLAAYILDRFMIFTDKNNKNLPNGGIAKYSTIDLLDNIVIYWATGTITTSMRLYKESFSSLNGIQHTLNKIATSVPTWALRLKHEVVFQPEFVLKLKYTNLLGTTTRNYGGHFAAFELPQEFADDVFLAVDKFKKFRDE